MDNELRPQRRNKILHDYDTRLSNEDMKAFRDSKIVQTAEDIFENADRGLPMTLDDVCDARDYLITMITLKTDTRPGALENVTLTHYEKREKDSKTGNSVILVPRQKRQKDGLAMLCLEKMSQLMHTYVTKIHQQYSGPGSDKLFLQKNGTPFQDGKLVNRLPAFWGKSGVRNGIRVTATNIRKWIVTKCHTRKMEEEEVDEDVLGQAMCHSDKVARTHYLRMDKTSIAARASEIIARCTDDIDHNATAKHSKGQTQKQTTTPDQEQIE